MSTTAPAIRSANIKICQTKSLVLVSILEPGLRESEVSVLIDPRFLSVLITRADLDNPVISGSLFGAVEKNHCRVRVKPDSVVIKLRKKVKGSWKSILQDPNAPPPEEEESEKEGEDSEKELPEEVEVETRADPYKEVTPLRMQDPIVPRERAAADRMTVAEGGGVKFAPPEEKTTIKASESLVQGVMDKIKQFHQDLFFDPKAYLNKPAIEQPPTTTEGPPLAKIDHVSDCTPDQSSDDECTLDSYDTYDALDGPLIKGRTQVGFSE